jgi:hypothetical protein
MDAVSKSEPRSRGDLRDERGAYAVLFMIITVVIFTMIGIAVDLSSQTAYARDNRTRADFAAMAAGSKLPGDPLGACNEAWKFIKGNTPGLPAGAVSPCASGVPQAFNTVCNASTPAVVYQATNTGPVYQISFTYPVPNSDPAMEGRTGPPSVDGVDSERCQRMAVTIRSNHATLFGGIIKSGQLSAPATSVVRARLVGKIKVPVALLILDPYGCNALNNSGQGGAYVYASDVNNPGFISVDSNGTKVGNPNRCDTSNAFTLDVSGTGNANIKACANVLDPVNPTNCTDPGVIDLYAFASGQTTCSNGVTTACDPTDVDNGTLYPQPLQEVYRATEFPAFRRWNCRGPGVATYPVYQPYLGLQPIAFGDCDRSDPSDSPAPYIDNLKTLIGVNSNDPIPAGFCDLNSAPAPGCPAIPNYPSGVACSGPNALSPSSPPVQVPLGNWDITCAANKSLTIPNLVTFAPGSNIVVDNGLTTATSGVLSVNSTTPGVCDAAQPNVYMFFRGQGSFVKNAQSSLTLCHTMVFMTGQTANGTPPNLDFGAGSGTLVWVAPTAGQFNGLALWSEGSSNHGLGGQTNLTVQGVFFAPLASPFTFTGQPGLNQTQAQFVTFRMEIKGQGTLTMVPSPSNALLIPKFGWALIR